MRISSERQIPVYAQIKNQHTCRILKTFKVYLRPYFAETTTMIKQKSQVIWVIQTLVIIDICLVYKVTGGTNVVQINGIFKCTC